MGRRPESRLKTQPPMAWLLAAQHGVTDAVLVVEVDSTLRKSVAQRLHLDGFAPITTPCAREALQLLRFGVPARLIVLGLTVPLLDAATLRQEIRRRPAFAHIPVVALTGSDASSFRVP